MAPRGRILIVDDEANARAALAEILREEGYTTETAADGFKALGKLEEFAPDVVLTDLKMPGLDGIGLMEKAQESRIAATFVVMTAFGTIDSAVEAIKLGAMHYLTKPASVDEILASFDRTLAVTEVEAPSSPRPLDEVEWEHLQKVLTDCGGNVSEAARRLGMHRRSLQRKLARGRPEA